MPFSQNSGDNELSTVLSSSTRERLMEQDWPLSRVSVAPRLPPPCPAGTAGACNPPSLVLGDNLACNCGIAVIAYVSKPKESKKNTDICADSYRPLRATVPPKLMFCKSARVSTSTGSLNPQLQVQQSDKYASYCRLPGSTQREGDLDLR